MMLRSGRVVGPLPVFGPHLPPGGLPGMQPGGLYPVFGPHLPPGGLHNGITNMVWGAQVFLANGGDVFQPGTYTVTVTYNATHAGRYTYVRYAVANVTTTEPRTRAELGDLAVDEVDTDDEYSYDSPPEVEVVDVDVLAVDGGGLFNMAMWGPRAPSVGDEPRTLERMGFLRIDNPHADTANMQYADNMDIAHHVSGTQCVADYMLWEAAKTDSRKGHWTRAYLNEKLGNKPTVQRIIALAREEGDVAVFACDILFKVFAEHRPDQKKPRVYLVFMVKENHCLPITNAKWRSYLTRGGELPLQPFSFTRSEVKGAVVLPVDISVEGAAVEINNAPDGVTAIIAPMESLDEVCAEVMKTCGKVVEASSWTNGRLAMFRHPVSGIIVVAGPDYPKRKEFCDKFYEANAIEDTQGNVTEFVNQGWGSIGADVLRAKHLTLPNSEYPAEYKTILQQYPLGPYRARTTGDKATQEGDKSVDIRRCYSYLLQNAMVDWPVFGPMDYARVPLDAEREPAGIVSGEYYISRTFFLGAGTIKLSRGWYPAALALYARQHEYISATDLAYVLPASKRVPKDAFVGFCKDVEESYTDASKEILNLYVGCLGSLYSHETRCGFTTDVHTAACTVGMIQSRGNVARTTWCGDVYMVQETTRRMRGKGNVPLFRAILGGSYMMLDKIIRTAGFGPEHVLCFNTDCVKVRGVQDVAGAANSKEDAQWGDFYVEVGPVRLTGRPLDELPVRAAFAPNRAPVEYNFELGPDGEPALGHADEAARLQQVNAAAADAAKASPCVVNWLSTMPCGASFASSRAGALFMGPPGCGKTYLMANLYHALVSDGVDDDTVVVTAYTHAACANLRAKGLPARVFNSIVWNPTLSRMDGDRLSSAKFLLLDEYTMLPPSEMRVLLDASTKYGFTVWAAGDHMQCCAPVDNPVSYHTNPHFLAMCGSRLYAMAYKPDTGRYDESLRSALEHFQVTRTVSAWKTQLPFTELCYFNVCFTNAKRAQLNKACLATWLDKETHGVPLTISGPGRKSMVVCKGLTVMAYHGHILEHDILKTQRWKIEAIDIKDSKLMLSTTDRDEMVELGFAEFLSVFDYCFAVTTHKIQGLTIAEDYVVHECNHRGMSFNVLYTALSRGVTLAKVHLQDVDNWDRTYDEQRLDTPTSLALDSLKPTHEEAFIYAATIDAPGTIHDDLCVAGCALGSASKEQLAVIERDGSYAVQERLDCADLKLGSGTVRVRRSLFVQTPALLLPAFRAWFVREQLDYPDIVSIHVDDTDARGNGDTTETERGRKRKRVAENTHAPDKVTTATKERKDKFAVRQYPNSAYFSVRYESKRVNEEHRVKNFKYKAGDVDSEARARAKAEAWSAQMKALYV